MGSTGFGACNMSSIIASSSGVKVAVEEQNCGGGGGGLKIGSGLGRVFGGRLMELISKKVFFWLLILSFSRFRDVEAFSPKKSSWLIIFFMSWVFMPVPGWVDFLLLSVFALSFIFTAFKDGALCRGASGWLSSP